MVISKLAISWRWPTELKQEHIYANTCTSHNFEFSVKFYSTWEVMLPNDRRDRFLAIWITGDIHLFVRIHVGMYSHEILMTSEK